MSAPSISALLTKAVAPTVTTICTLDVRSQDLASLWVFNPSATETLYCVVQSSLDEADEFAPSTLPDFAAIPPASDPVKADIDCRGSSLLRLVGFYSGAGDTVQFRALAGAVL